MAKGWKCPRCSTANDDAAITCLNCGFIRGGVVVPGSFTPPSKPGAGPDQAVPPVEPPIEPPIEAPAAPSGVGWAALSAPTSGPAAPRPTRSIWRRIPLQWLIFAVLIGAGSIGGWFFNANRSGNGEITKGGDLTVTELRVGDCWDEKDPSSQKLTDVSARRCTEPHEYEVFFSGSMPGGAFPTNDAFEAFYKRECVPAFDAFVGMAYADSELEILGVEPTRDSWASGDRVVQCSVHHPTITRLTASLKGSNQ